MPNEPQEKRNRGKKMNDPKRTGRVTIPTNLDVVPETIEILKRWGADAIRDCDGTDYPAPSSPKN